jgi:hypothetical protein
MPKERNTNLSVEKNGPNQPTDEQKPVQPDEKQSQTVDFDSLFSNPDFKKRLDDYTRKSNETAVRTALQKAERANNEKLTRAERLQAMSDADKVKFLEDENKKLTDRYARDKEIESLRTQTAGMLTESKIPPVFLDIFDFENATAEDIKKRVGMLAEYEYYPKGELEKQITAGVNDKLKQKTPETRGTGDGSPPPKMPQFF